MSLIGDKMRENKLRWFERILRRMLSASINKIESTLMVMLVVERMTKLDVNGIISNDMETCLTKDTTLERAEWKNMIHVGDPKEFGDFGGCYCCYYSFSSLLLLL